MHYTEWIIRSDGRRVAISRSFGEEFLDPTTEYFAPDPDEASLHAPPRDVSPPSTLDPLQNANVNSHGTQICERCATVDFANPLPLSSEMDWGEMREERRATVDEAKARGDTQIEGHVCVLGQFPSDFRIADCPVCRTLADIRTRLQPAPFNLPQWPYELHVVSAAYVHLADDGGGAPSIPDILDSREIVDTTLFAVDPKPPHIFFYGRVGFFLTEHSGTSGHLYPVATGQNGSKRGFWGRRLRADCVDYSILRFWIDSCKTYHQDACSPVTGVSLTNFRLIDCEARTIVNASTEMRYVALSYVWGQLSTFERVGLSLGSTIGVTAQVIEDAMAVTTGLGLKYLWVDRFCVRQDDLTSHMEQIHNMDAVYSAAEVTIIAAAGENADFGLPGISKRHRRSQPSFQVQDQVLVSSGPRLLDLLPQSKWASRGWTYQEGLLSRRRLIFTEYQIYFECGSSHCCEAITAPADVLFQEKSVPTAHSMASQKFRVFPTGNPVGKANHILNLIEAYVQKDFTYNSDILNGILGIFGRFRKSQPSATHFWGIPILTQTELKKPRFTSSESDPETKEPLFITRGANEALLFGLRWNISRTSRNPDFPSWSWTGWIGPFRIRFPAADEIWAIPEVSPNVQFWVETEDAQCVDWAEFHASQDREGNLRPVSKFLHVEGPAVKLQFEHGQLNNWIATYPPRPTETGLHVRLEINELQISICPLWITKSVDDVNTFNKQLLAKPQDALILSYCGESLPAELDTLGQEMELTYKMLASRSLTSIELLVLEQVQDRHERLGTVRLVFPEHLELPSPGSLKIERKRFRLG